MKDFWAAFVGYFLATFAVLAVQSWLVMLAVGMLHTRVAEVPAISYGGASVLVLLVYLLVTPATAAVKASA